MDELSRALDENLLKTLECPVCMEYMVPPIKLCTNGHNICSKCRESVQCCPTCRAEFTEIRCLALEDIARSQKYPCTNRQRGCLELFTIEHIAVHQAVCVYGNIKCVFSLTNKCSWNGFKTDFKEHAKAAHPQSFIQHQTINDSLLTPSAGILFCFGELFTFFKQKKDGRYNSAVQLIGTNKEASKYKCQYILRTANGIEEISKTFLVQGYSGDFGTIFNSRKCLNLDEETINLFVVDGNLKFTATLFKV